MNHKPALLTSILTVAEMTLREALRKRFILIILFISSFFLLINLSCESAILVNGEEKKASAAGEFFFFFLVTFWNFGIAEQITSSLITDELENKNYLILLSKPVSKQVYFLGKMTGIMGIILANTFLIYGVYSCSTLIRFGTVNPELWKAVVPMFIGFIELVSIVILLALSINKAGAVMLSSALVVISLIIDGLYYTPEIESKIREAGIYAKVGEIFYWVLPQFGSLYYYASSFFQKGLAQTHYLGEYSMIQMGSWILITWAIMYYYLENKEFDG